MTKQQRNALAEQVRRGAEIKRMISDLNDELDDILEALDHSGLDRLDVEFASAVKVSQVRRLFSQAEACKLLGKKAEACFYDRPVVFWKIS